MESEFISKYGTDDPRLGDLIKPFTESGTFDVVLLGFPHDEGVRRNGGRVGAAKGPTTIRTLIPRIGAIYNSEYAINLSKLKIGDAGDVMQNLNLNDAHASLRSNVKRIIEKGAIPFVIGGGNDQSYPNAQGFMDSVATKLTKGFTVINIDAHLDVRPLKDGKPHSGSPFRQLSEDPKFQEIGGNLIEFGAQGHQCSREHWNYVLNTHKGEIYSLSHLRNSSDSIVNQFAAILNKSPESVFVSFDIDSISSADCPGVSAPAAIGLSSQEALDICYQAGLNPKVKLVDVSEFNPEVESYRTGRLVSTMFYFFLLGYAKRNSMA